MALTLTRKTGQAVVLLIDGEQVARVEVTHERRAHDCRVMLTFDAPQHVRILREEILDSEPRSAR